jgi:cell division protein FtsL
LSKLNLLLLLALLGSCLLLVRSAYESRRVFAALDDARVEQQLLDAEFKRLDAERQQQATNHKVDRVARDRLGMNTVTPGATTAVFETAASGLVQ